MTLQRLLLSDRGGVQKMRQKPPLVAGNDAPSSAKHNPPNIDKIPPPIHTRSVSMDTKIPLR